MNIKEIWAQLGQQQRNDIMTSIVKEGMVSYSTAAGWCNGSRVPLHLYRVKIREIFSRVLGEEYSVGQLWPERRN